MAKNDPSYDKAQREAREADERASALGRSTGINASGASDVASTDPGTEGVGLPEKRWPLGS
ncbi:MAG TPA: hypothetical protein V6C72_06605 [Chroococcales cyanobacterium]